MANCLLALMAIWSMEGGAPQHRVVLTTHVQEPLTFVNAKHQIDGIALKPVAYALDRMRWTYEIQFLPWARAQSMVKEGVADGFFAASRNAERDSFAQGSEAIAYQTIKWYTLASNPLRPDSPGFKANAKVTGYVGSNMLKWLTENKYNIVGAPATPDQMFLMLANGRVDACLANDYNYTSFILEHPELESAIANFTEHANPLFVYFSKPFLERNPGFLKEFDKGVREYMSRKR